MRREKKVKGNFGNYIVVYLCEVLLSLDLGMDGDGDE
jgi:hypothetical protein